MKKYMFLFLLLALLSGCAAAPQETPTPTEAPTVEVTPEPTPEVTPTPEPTPTPTDTDPEIYAEVPISLLDLSSYEGELSNEEWEALRGFFPVLNNEVPMLAAHLSTEAEGVTPTEEVFFRDIYEAYDPESGLPPSRYLAMSFSLAPVVGEELDLVLVMNSFNGWHLLIHREGERFYAVYIPFRWFKSLQTDGLYLGSGGAATSYYYRLHFSNGTFTEELLANTDWGAWVEEGNYSGYYAIGGTEVTQTEFDAWLENVFFTEDAVWRPARAKSLEPWQEAYWDILTNPGKCEGFYAVAEHVPSENLWRLEATIEDGDPYYFAIADLNHDEIPELLLGIGFTYSSPRVLLNILRYNEETDVVEDMDGPRTYPLMDNLWFSDTGYFSTINGAGGLYTEFWHLEDPDPDHYWSGCERNAHFNENGELESWEEFPFSSSDGKEKFTLQEYYDLLGESGIGVEWQELTPKNIRQAFFSAEGEEVAP